MKEKTKYLLSLLAVLILGFMLGFLINGRITKARVSRMQNYFTEQGFNRAFFQVIRPTPEQMQELKPVFKKISRQNRQRFMNFREAQKNTFDSLEKEIRPYLRKDQLQRLEQLKRQHARGGFNRGPGRRGPPRGGFPR